MLVTVLVALAELGAAEIHAAGYRLRPRPAMQAEIVQGAPQDRAGGAAEMEPLTNPRTGVTCTMRILKAEPIDSKAVLPGPETSVDPDIHGRGVSPCVD